MKKKILAIGLASLMLLSCVACGGNPGDNSDKKEPSGNQTVTPGGDDPDKKPDEPVGYVPYDESLRVEDTRKLSAQEYTKYNITATDDFGRTVLTVDGKESKDSYVGLFYFLWLGYHNPPNTIYDIDKITNGGANHENFQKNSAESPVGPYHHWGESLFGYYNSEDPWVIRKHVEMLCLSGIDFLIFDVTNGYTYPEASTTLLNIFMEYYNVGWDVPKIMYYIADTDSCERVLTEVYNLAYSSDKYKPLWFCPNGKPLVTLPQKYFDQGSSKNYGLDMNNATLKKCAQLFEFKCRQWPNEGLEDDGVPWMEFKYPQPAHNGWMNVSIGQHLTIRFSDMDGTHGRGWDGVKNDHERWREDLNFQRQWDTVLKNKKNVRFTFVTGWNEWIAMKMGKPRNYFTVDTYNPEYSRDIEPSKNAGDNTFLLLSKKIREYNYTQAKHYIYPKTTIDITKDDEKWRDIKTYVDLTADCTTRDFQGYATGDANRYRDTTGRNDIAALQVARDEEYMYFRVTVAGTAITEHKSGDQNWMNIWLKTRNGKDSYNGYHYVLNRSVDGNKTKIMKATENGTLAECGTGDLFISGNVMVVRVKLSDLELSATNYDIEFKVTDNIPVGDKFGENFGYLAFYNTGDAAPIGRFNYRYGY